MAELLLWPSVPLVQPVALPFPLPKLRGRSFQDSFTADATGTVPSGWAGTVGAGTVYEGAGGLIFTTSASGDLTVTGRQFADVLIEWSWVWTAINDTVIWARYGGSRANAYQFDAYSGTSLIAKLVGDTRTVVAMTGGPNQTGKLYTGRASCIESTITFQIDGFPAMKVSDSSHTSGSVGFGFYGAAGTFKYFRVVTL